MTSGQVELVSQHDLTRLIGVLVSQRERARHHSERRRINRLIEDLCTLGQALYELQKADAQAGAA